MENSEANPDLEIIVTQIHSVQQKRLFIHSLIRMSEDQPVYEVKYEIPEIFRHILPVLGGFHIQCAFMATMYRRFRGSGFEDWVRAAGIVEAGSVEQALRGNT